jgi:hypothetical protein
MTIRDAEENLRSAIRERVLAAAEGRGTDICGSADALVELAIGRLVLTALSVGRPRPPEVEGHA